MLKHSFDLKPLFEVIFVILMNELIKKRYMKHLKKNILFGTIVIMPFILVEAMLVVMFYDSFIVNEQDNLFARFNVFKGLIYVFIAYPILSVLWAQFHEEFRFRGYVQNLMEENITVLQHSLVFLYTLLSVIVLVIQNIMS